MDPLQCKLSRWILLACNIATYFLDRYRLQKYVYDHKKKVCPPLPHHTHTHTHTKEWLKKRIGEKLMANT